jgi:hypothetical protein
MLEMDITGGQGSGRQPDNTEASKSKGSVKDTSTYQKQDSEQSLNI